MVNGLWNWLLAAPTSIILTWVHVSDHLDVGTRSDHLDVGTRSDHLDVGTRGDLLAYHQHQLDLLYARKRLGTAAQALAGSSFSVLFRAVEEAHHHEHGLSAIFVILQNDGEDYFYNTNVRTIE
jgi:hypothetical protein